MAVSSNPMHLLVVGLVFQRLITSLFLRTYLAAHALSESLWCHLCLHDVLSVTEVVLKHVTPLLDKLDHHSGSRMDISPW